MKLLKWNSSFVAVINISITYFLKHNCKYYISILFFLVAISLKAGQNPSDSLKALLSSSGNDSTKVKLLHQLYLTNDSLNIAIQALELSQQINYKEGIALSLLDIGRWYYFDGKEDIALNYLRKSLKHAEELNAKNILKSIYRYIGFIYRPHEPIKAKEYYTKSLNMALETGDDLSVSYALSAIGNIYEGIAEKNEALNKTALKYYLNSLSIREKHGSYSEIASSLNETSRMYDALGQYSKSLELRLRGLSVAEKNNDKENLVYLGNLLGNDYSNRLKDYKTALQFQMKAFEIGKDFNNKNELMYDVTKSIAFCYSYLNEHKLATDFFKKSITYYELMKEKEKKYDYNLALVKDEIEKELEKQKLLLKDADILKEKAEAEKQTTKVNALFVIFCLLLIFAVVVYKGYKHKLKSNIELDARNREIEIAYRTLEVSEGKLKQITETINDVFYLYNIIEKKYEYISPNCELVLGLKQRYFYEGKNTKLIVLEEDLQLVKDANVKIDSGIPYDIEYRIIANGEMKWIAEKSSPIRDKEGNLIKNSGICRDITKRKYIEEKLRIKSIDLENAYESLAISENNFKEIAKTIVNVFYLYNIIEKKIEYISPNSFSILGVDSRLLYSGLSLKSIVIPDDVSVVANAEIMMEAGIAFDIEYRIQIKGEERWIAEKSTPIFDNSGKLIKNSGIYQDITKKKHSEAIIRKKNKDITDSIHYARTIQNAILVPESKMATRLKEVFVLSKPKEIVSGDFHFYKETKNGLYLAVADSTGHGVPAGFMSMIGLSFLNEIIDINPRINPALVLNQLRDMIIKALNQNTVVSESREGMDIALLYFDKGMKEVEYAGAFNSLYLVRDNELIEYKADLFPIGLNFGRDLVSFSTNKIKIQSGDSLYIFSDGYFSQFGGPKNKKYSRKLFQSLLLSINEKSMQEQYNALDSNFEEWKGKNEQVDDVCVIGVKI